MSATDRLLAGLDPEQRQVAETLRGPVCVIAGAGTGKTRAITHRIAYGVATGVYNPSSVLAVTFTVRAAAEMRERLGQLGAPSVQTRTFHSAALSQLRYFWPKMYGVETPKIMESKFGFVAEAAKRMGVHGERSLIRDLASEIEWSKVSLIPATDYASKARERGREVADLDIATVTSVLLAYEDIKRERGFIDMEDILLLNLAVLADEPRAAAEVRRTYRHFVVDEYQDVNPAQAALLDVWLGGRDEVCVVGDPRQTIYSFAGASAQILHDFTRTYPDAQRIELVRNYRSTPQIVAAANDVFPRGASTTLGVRLVSQNDPGPAIAYREFAYEAAEAAGVAQAVADANRRGIAYRDMAILYRINAQSEQFEEALSELGIPYTLRGGEGFFNRAEVRQAITLLRGAAVAEGGAGPESTLVPDVEAVLSSMGHTSEAPKSAGAVRDRWESLNAIVSMTEDLVVQNPDASLQTLVADLERRAEIAHAPSGDGVTLATLHTAKGLEWDAVFLAGVHEGSLPFIYASEPAQIEEERRLFYVGLTRARRELMVSWSTARREGGKATRKASRFLDRLRPATPAGSQTRSVRQPRCRVCHTELAVAERKLGVCSSCPTDYDTELFESLREWRRETAGSKPAFTVFNDAVLLEVSRVKPRSENQLATIKGIGPAKIELYGEALLELVRDSL